MGIRFKYSIAFCMLSALLVHFGLVFIYSSPYKVSNSDLTGLSKSYVYPFFNQGWSFFVPVPTRNDYLYIKLRDNSGVPQWKLVLPIRQMPVQKRDLLSKELFSLLFSQPLYYELKSLPRQSNVFYSKPTNKEFEVLNYSISKYLKHRFNIREDESYELLLISGTTKERNIYLFKNVSPEK